MTRLTPISPPDNPPPVAARRLILPAKIQLFFSGRRSLKPFPGIEKTKSPFDDWRDKYLSFYKKIKDANFQTYPPILAGKG